MGMFDSRLLLMLLASCVMTAASAADLRAVAPAQADAARQAAPTKSSTTKPATTTASSADDATPAPRAEPAAKAGTLDLRLGNALRYFQASELETPLDERLEEIIVNGQRPEPLRDRRNVPIGLLPSLAYAARNPLDLWRIVAPVPNVQLPDRNVDDPKDPPGTYRGRILEPGAIYD